MGKVDVNKLAEQVQLLTDIEAIKLLKYQYARGCEQAMMEGNNKPVLATLTPDAAWDGGDLGHYEGHDQLDQFFSGQITYADLSEDRAQRCSIGCIRELPIIEQRAIGDGAGQKNKTDLSSHKITGDNSQKRPTN